MTKTEFLISLMLLLVTLFFMPLVYAANLATVESECTACHDGLTINGTVIGGGSRIPLSSGREYWLENINRMNVKGAFVPTDQISAFADYFVSLEATATTSTIATTTSTTTGSVTTTTLAAEPGTCPANSTGTYPGCTCNSGYTMSGSMCSTTTLIDNNQLAGLFLITSLLLFLFMGFQAGLVR